MTRYYLISYLLVFVPVPSYQTGQSTAGTGSIELNEIYFDKIIRKFDAALVKFDVAFPYGEKHEAFVALAPDSKDSDELIVAEVGVKDYGNKDNEALARKYGASKDNFPVVKLFIKGKSEPITFDDSKGFTSDELRKFVREKTGIHLTLPGCVRQLDVIAVKFMKADKGSREGVIREVDGIQLPEKDKATTKVYKTYMQKILEKGNEFIDTEFERVKKLLAGKLSEEKKKELGNRLNILQTFQFQVQGKKEQTDEL